MDVDPLSVFSHAPYLCQDAGGLATLLDGTKRSLIRLKKSDFDWQNKYFFATPVHLPKGSALSMVYTYDNSSNPHSPPKRVTLGLESTDEMGNLTYEVLTQTGWHCLNLFCAAHARRISITYWLTIHQLGRLMARHRPYAEATGYSIRATKSTPILP